MPAMPSPEERDQYATAGMAWGMGCSIVASILVCVLGGLALDKVLDTTPLFTLIGVALGLLASGYQLWELARLGSKTARPGPVSRQVARVQNRQRRRKRSIPGSEDS